MFAGSELDLVIGLDIHMEMVPMPAPTPTPFPMPFVGQIEQKPLEMLAQFGMAKALSWAFDTPPTGPVVVNGYHAAKTGDLGKNGKTLPHVVMPPGTAWTPLPKPLKLTPKPPPPPPDSPSAPPGDAVLFTGSQTVYFEQCNATRLGTQAMSCSDPVRLPSSNLLAVPKGQPVLVGGPPAFDAMAAAGAFFLRNKWTAGALQEVASAVAPGGRMRNLLSWGACTLTGHPVDVATGRLLTRAEDARLDGAIPLVFERYYSSAWSERASTLGYGWSHSLDEWIAEERGKVVYKLGDGREVEFQCLDLPDRRMREGDELFYAIDRLWLTRTRDGFRVRSADGLVRVFTRVRPEDKRWSLGRIEDRQKRAVLFHYDAQGLLERVETDDRWIRLEHRNGLLHRVLMQVPESDGWYDRVTFAYAREGDLVGATDSQGQSRTYAYDAHLLVRETDRDGVSFWFEYDGRDAEASCVRTWGDDGQGSDRLYFREITYDKKKLVTLVEDSFGQVTTYKLNVVNAVVETLDPHGASTKVTYDDHLWKTAETDPLGQTTRHEYDARGNETKRILANGAAFTLRYDADDRLVEIVDPRGERWSWAYAEPLHWTTPDTRLLARRTPTSTTRYRYQGDTTVLDVDGRVFSFERNVRGQLVKITYPSGASEERGYDRQGRLVRVRDSAGRVRTIAYDWESRVIETTEPGGLVRRFQYSGEGDVVAYSDPLRQVSYGYRGFHKIAWREEGGARIEYRYTSEDDLIAIANEAGEIYSFSRDACGRVVEEVGFDGRKHTFVRDVGGRVTTVFKPSKAAETLSFNPLGQVTAIKYADGTAETFTYDLVGALETATNPAGTVRFERDGGGRVVRESFNEDWVASAYERGARTKVTSSTGLAQQIERDAMNDVVGLGLFDPSDGSGRAPWRIGFERDDRGMERGRTLPGGVSTAWTRSELGLPESFALTRGGGALAQARYAWEGDGRLVAAWEAGKGNTSYAHDERNRLVAARPASGAVEWRVPGPTGDLFRTPEQTDRRYGRGGVLLEGEGARYRYDADGNVVEKVEADGAKWAYVWNANGTLAKATRIPADGNLTGAKEVTFRYDALRRRVEKIGDGGKTSWRWDGDVPLHEVVERGGRARAETWIFEPGTFAPVGKIGADGRRYGIVTDYLGTPREMIDEAGRIAWKAQLDVHGVARVEAGGAEDCPWRWPGQYEDAETGLYYNRFRYYDPKRGDYLSRDPLALAGGTRAYGYVVDPLRWIDPYGLHTVLAGFTPAGSSTTSPVINPRTGTDRWPNVPGSGANGPAASGFGRAGDSENELMDHLASTRGDELSGGVLTITSIPSGGRSSLPPCDACDAGMQSFADTYGVTIVYAQSGRGGMPVGDPQVYKPKEGGEQSKGCAG